MNRVKAFIRIFLTWTLVGTVSKAAFIAFYYRLLDDDGIGSLALVLWHGLRLDTAVAGYLTAPPALMLMASLWCNGRSTNTLWKAYFAVTATACALAYTANIGLYTYWGFPLDDTPLLYLKTSPADALASMETWQMAVAAGAVIAVAAAVYRLMPALPTDCLQNNAKRTGTTALLAVMTAALILPIRGGTGTGTNHTGSVYFSTDIRLNHAAVNPLFSFVEAAIHHQDIATKYRFMQSEEAERLFKAMTYTTMRHNKAEQIRPNVILIVLESFSDTIMSVPGVTPRLRQMTHEGIYFSNIYASSFRTDRALLSIHSALPAQPTMSLMDIPKKSTALPSIAEALARNGYTTTFYYGGDVNYSNMRSYFIGTGFQRIVSENDFPRIQRTGKWGVADGPVYERMIDDIKVQSPEKPFFMSIMTESSHEPFDVPEAAADKALADDKVLNAFAYADRCLGKFVDTLKDMPCWDNTLLVVVPDHLGAFPDEVDNYQLWRYRLPLVIIGGALTGNAVETGCLGGCTNSEGKSLPTEIKVVGSQTDIAATLLAMLGIDHSEFLFSKDLLDAQAPHFAFFSFPDAIGMVTDTGCVIYDNTAGKVHTAYGPHPDSLLSSAKAYLQCLYDFLESL